MGRWHFTQHGTAKKGDALDLYLAETSLLAALFAHWESTRPTSDDPAAAVRADWEHGTLGKLLLEHAAVQLAAREDLVRVLEAAGTRDEAAELEHRVDEIRPVIDRMDESSRGIEPVPLAITPKFVEAVEELHRLLRDHLEPGSLEKASERLAAVLGPHRSELRSAKFIRRHSPSHPGRRTWVTRVPALVRLQAGYDRMRGFPWAESTMADAALAEHYDKEV